MPTPQDALRTSRILAGFAVVLLLLIGETVVADRRLPNPASPYVWTALGLGALGCALGALWFRRKARGAGG
jgi:hypothetical protein